MQEPVKKKKSGRSRTFLMSPRGQVFATCCAFGGLTCLIISFLLNDYTRLAWPFVLASFLLAGLGMVSKARRGFAQIVWLLWVIQANPFASAAFNLGDMADLQPQLQQQTVRIENQYRKLQEQENTLATQLALLQNLFQKSPVFVNGTNQYYTALQATQIELPDLQKWTDDSKAIADYNIFLLEKNARNLPDTSLLKNTKDEVAFDPIGIQVYQEAIGNASQTIANNNLVLPMAVIPTTPVVDQADCVSGFACTSRLSWQQPFVDGWLALSRTPFSITWPFWLSLLLALAGMFLLLPRSLGPRWVVNYRVRYSGPLFALNDPAFPEQKRLDLSGEASIVKIEVRSTLFLLKQKDWTDETRELVRLKLGTGTSISSVFSKETGTSEVSYDTTSGEIVVKVKSLTPIKFERGTSFKARRALIKSQSRFPIILYAVVDYFAGSLEATTPITEVERLQEQRGPTWLLLMANIFHELVWWLYATGLFLALEVCSLMFFGDASYSYPPLFLTFGLGGLGATLVLQIAEVVIKRTITRQQKPAPALLPAA